VASKEDRERLAKVRYASPQLRWDWLDSDGKVWKGLTIQHIAATPIPKQRGQNAFNLSDGSFRIPDEEIIRLSEGTPMADKKDETPDEVEGGGESVAGFSELIEALKGTGMNIPDEVNDIPGLIIAVKASGGSDDDSMDDDEDPNAMPDNVGDTQAAPVGLSNAEKKSLARAETLTRVDIDQRINRLLRSGRITPPIASKLKAQSGKVQLSFTPDGDLKENALVIRIDAYESLPKGTAWRKNGKRVNLSDADVREVDPPDSLRGGVSDAEALATWDKT
jgi:hypothetical protein